MGKSSFCILFYSTVLLVETGINNFGGWQAELTGSELDPTLAGNNYELKVSWLGEKLNYTDFHSSVFSSWTLM